MIGIGNYVRLKEGRGPVYSKHDESLLCCGFSENDSKCEFYVKKKNYLKYLISRLVSVNPKDLATPIIIADFADMTCEYCRGGSECGNPEVKIAFAIEEL